MAKVWILDVHIQDGPEGGEIIGVYRSRLKARRAAAQEQGVLPHEIPWEKIAEYLYSGEHQEVVETRNYYTDEPEESTVRTTYFIKQWTVQ